MSVFKSQTLYTDCFPIRRNAFPINILFSAIQQLVLRDTSLILKLLKMSNEIIRSDWGSIVTKGRSILQLAPKVGFLKHLLDQLISNISTMSVGKRLYGLSFRKAVNR